MAATAEELSAQAERLNDAVAFFKAERRNDRDTVSQASEPDWRLRQGRGRSHRCAGEAAAEDHVEESDGVAISSTTAPTNSTQSSSADRGAE